MDARIAALDATQLAGILRLKPAGETLEYLLLRAAAVNPNHETLEQLLYTVGSTEIKDREGYRPIHLATMHNDNPKVIEVLIKAGAEIDSRGPYFNMTALMMAAEKGRFESARALVRLGADINLISTAFGRTALLATQGKHPRIAELLLEAGADPYHENIFGATLIFSLPQGGDSNLEIADLLLTAGYDLNRPSPNGRTPLIHTLHYVKHKKGRKLLARYLEAGSHLNRLDKEGDEAVNMSLKRGLDEVIDQVASHLQMARDFNDDALISLIRFGSLPQIQAAWDGRGLGPNEFLNQSGLTALMWAAHSNTDPEVVEYFMAAGGEVEGRDYAGRSPLMLSAMNNGNPAIVASLLAAGAQIGARDDSANTALLWAARNNSNPEILKTLITAGASVEEADKFGRTPWIWAVKNRQKRPILKALTAAGADVSAEDIWGSNAMAYYTYIGREKADLRNEFKIKTSRSEFWQTAAKDLKYLARWQELALKKSKNYTDDLIILTDLAQKDSKNEYVHRLSPAATSGRLRLSVDGQSRPAWKLEVDYVSPWGETISLGADHNFLKNEEALWLYSHRPPEELRLRLYNFGHDKINLPLVNHYPNSILASAASRNCDPEAIRMLVNEGADVNMVTENSYQTALYSAALNSDCPVIIETLISAGAVVDLPHLSGRTPLMAAVGRPDENQEIVKALLAAGADPNFQDTYGMTPLRIAKSLGRLELMEVLRAAGALQ